jgi:tRNA (guanine-N7-)-methyltransferase
VSAEVPRETAKKLHGRRKGKPLSARREGLMAGLLPALQLDLSRPFDGGALFGRPVSALRVEVGFGGGEHLVSEARRNPQTGFIGVEPFLNGMAKILAAIEQEGLSNIRLHGGDAADVFDWLPAGSLSRVDVLYPDPWPKKRHWKRRFVSPANLGRIARTLAPAGSFRVASDIAGYIEWTLLLTQRHPDFAWTARTPDDWQKPWRDWPGTRYEAKALREGRTPTYLVFERR